MRYGLIGLLAIWLIAQIPFGERALWDDRPGSQQVFSLAQQMKAGRNQIVPAFYSATDGHLVRCERIDQR